MLPSKMQVGLTLAGPPCMFTAYIQDGTTKLQRLYAKITLRSDSKSRREHT